MFLQKLFLWMCLVTQIHAFDLSSLLGMKLPQPTSSTLSLQYTYLEINGMLWKIPGADLSLVVDPIASQLDFGIPWAVRLNKKVLDQTKTLDIICQANPSHCLLSMGLDDHTHPPTLTELAKRLPQLQFIVAPSAKSKVESIVKDSSRVMVLAPGESLSLNPSAELTATEGALVGPPWQKREDGWLLKVAEFGTVYMEAHGDVRDQELEKIGKADIVITPCSTQRLPKVLPEAAQYTLVNGGDRSLDIAKALQASVVIPLDNGNVDLEGEAVTATLSSIGDVDDFEKLAQERNAKSEGYKVRLERPSPGIPLTVKLC